MLHGTWSNPSYAVIAGRPQVIFPAGDGWIYSFEPKTGEILWKFDANPKDSVWRLGGAGTRNNIISMAVIYDDKVYVGVGQDPEHGEAPGPLLRHRSHRFGRHHRVGQGLAAAAARTSTAPSRRRRSRTTSSTSPTSRASSTPSNAQTGEHYWTYDVFAAVWGSTFVADGKVYLGDEDGDIIVLEEGKGKDGEAVEIAEMNMGAAVYTTPVAHDGTLFIASRNELFAIEEGAVLKEEKDEAAKAKSE